MKVGIVGCGYVASMYAKTAAVHQDLALGQAFDVNPDRLKRFCDRYGCVGAASLEDLLSDETIGLVLNLTNPRDHYDVTRACLEAGKHVYTEKPISMETASSRDLMEMAQARGLRIGCAPCGVLGNTAQTIWRALQDGVIGKVRLVYANYDDGMIAPVMQPWTWLNDLDVPWPAKDEFEVGCTYEHAGYFLTWLNAFFGPARTMTAFSSCQVPDKGIEVDSMAPDFSVGCIEYDDGVVARVTCGLVAPRDKSLMIVGDEGYLFVNYLRNDHEPVYLRRYKPSRTVQRIENRIGRLRARAPWLTSWLPWPVKEFLLYEKLPFALPVSTTSVSHHKRVDFMLGPLDMVRAIQENRPHRLGFDFGLHVFEQVERLQYPDRFDGEKRLTTSFEPFDPLPLIQE
ncbi:Gfo/Idh/MocA family oxidoreductase [uncultured Pelagimonas sp.]|uniref:Gfo/Idh/MocA family protein n=1 Tax=uncultured Pelagimonas sp. TaxID=1618102 RepID=UPI00261951F4|nr:Gfo/Idh/MocA family oxidoreductase [uncultured Pelagimonas sp.]